MVPPQNAKMINGTRGDDIHATTGPHAPLQIPIVTKTRRHLPMVCNLAPLELRALGWDVHEEYVHSSTPLMDHCCAACGRLLYSRTHAGVCHNPNLTGISGPACRVRGTHAAWDSLPLCLLLWSKERLAATLLRGISNLCPQTHALTLKEGPSTAP